MRRLILFFENLGFWKYIPLIGILSISLWHYYLANIAQEIYVGAYMNLFVGNVLPAFSAIWPILSLQDVLASPGGELYVHWKRNVFWWMGHVMFLMLLYALPAFGVASLFITYYSPLGLGFVVRYFLFSTLYAWFGFTVMWYVKEQIWALFATLLYLLVFCFGRMIQMLSWNPYRIDVNETFYAISQDHTTVTCIWIGVLFLLFMVGFYHRKSKR